MTTEQQPLVVGLGSLDRGDDAVGVLVAREVQARALPGVQVVEQEDPTALLDLWTGRRLAVVVDAVRSGGEPGALVRLETGDGQVPLLDSAWIDSGRGGTHGFGLAGAVELSRALGTLPARLVLVGIEAARFEPGDPVSPPVAAAVESVLELVGSA
jgi:hydrogenase maturation protease